MMFTIQAAESGKTIRVDDRTAGVTAFNGYVDLGETADVRVGSQDGKTGQVDIYYAVSGPANTVFGDSPNTVTAGQVLQVDGT